MIDPVIFLKEIEALLALNVDGEVIDYLPFDIDESFVEPVYKSIPGWKEDLTDVRNQDLLPKELNDYISFLEEELQVPITWLSVGPDREQTMTRTGALLAY